MRLLFQSALFIILVGILNLSHAQTGNGIIRGKIIDSQSALPLPFASIKIKSKMMGVVSNSDGDFQIPLKYKTLDDSIVISCIGYTTTTLSFNDLNENSINNIKVNPSVRSLDEVIITTKKRMSPAKVLSMAIENIKNNYPHVPFSYIAYYRDYQLLDTSYINLNEAIVEVFDEGFQTNDLITTKILLYEYKINTDFPRDTSTSIPYDNKPGKFGHGKNKYIPNAVLSPLGGNELSILRVHDAIRNNNQFSYSFINVFIQDFEKNHFLKMEKDVNLDTISLYCISFESKYSVSGPRNFSKGRLYIEKGKFAIHKIEYATYNKTMKETQLMYEIQTEYSRTGPFMHLNYISFANQFKTQNDTDFKVIEILYNKEKNAFVLDFNTIPEKKSVLDTGNYEFMIDNHHLQVLNAQLKGERQVYLFLDETSRSYLGENFESMSSKLKLNVKNVRDVDNRELDRITGSTLFQFRELFVQKLMPNRILPINTPLVNKNTPLSLSISDPSKEAISNFWMNSPLKKKE